MKIVFMGTPDFAVPTLDLLYNSGYEIVGVITSTDKWLGRGKKKLAQSPVKKYAVAKGLKVLQPKNLKASDFVEELSELKADIQVVVAFRMLPEVVWNMPPLGSINLHGSLLPAFRGAAPINWAVISGAKITGLTTFKLRHEIDTGSIIFHESLIIRPGDTAGDLHDKMMYMGAPLVLKTIRAIANDTVKFHPQDHSKVSHAPKVFHADSALDFKHSAEAIKNFIHGLSPYPTAWIMKDEKKIKLFRVKVLPRCTDQPVGQLIKGENNMPHLICYDGILEILEIQPEGKPKMDGRSFANGYL